MILITVSDDNPTFGVRLMATDTTCFRTLLFHVVRVSLTFTLVGPYIARPAVILVVASNCCGNVVELVMTQF